MWRRAMATPDLCLHSRPVKVIMELFDGVLGCYVASQEIVISEVNGYICL